MTRILTIEGMSCGHCVRRVSQALNAFEGLEAVVDLERQEARVTGDGGVSDTQLTQAVVQAGYGVTRLRQEHNHEG